MTTLSPEVEALARRAPVVALEAFKILKPPVKLRYSAWAEDHFVLAEGSSARAGRFRLWPYQPDWLDAMGDPAIERVTIIKSSRVGYTKCLMASIGATADNDPCAMILLVPTDDDARGYAVDEIEPAFAQSKRLAGLLKTGRVDGRNTLTVKKIPGGSLKILSARSPRNLRRHDAKKLFVDEEDGMEVTAEGDPVLLGEKRTLAHPDRKIIRGSTPTDELSSSINRAYLESDQRIFEVPCPWCGACFEILWPMIVWPQGEPEKAECVCPHCSQLIAERYKTTMVHNGHWRATKPEVKGHAGFRINTLVSLLANASWGKLAKEFLEARRGGPSKLQVFVNTVEGRVWSSTIDAVDPDSLAARVENFGLELTNEGQTRIPREVLAITAGVDTQPDRFEVTFWGWSQTQAYALGHSVIWGSPNDAATQAELDAVLSTKWRHPNGWQIGVEAAAIDSAGHNTQAVYDFCTPRFNRKIYAIVGRDGPRRVFEASKRKKDGVRLFIVGVDQVKTEVLQRIGLPLMQSTIPTGQDDAKLGGDMPGAIHLSSDLAEDWFDQIVGERRVIRYVHNRAVIDFRPRQSGQRVEALDCAVYAFAVRHSLRIDFAERRARTADPVKKRLDLGSVLPH